MNEQLNIKDASVRKLAVRLSKLTNLSLTAAVKLALEQQITREERASTREDRLKRIDEIVRAYNALPDRDTRSADEILGYDENGLPT